MKKTFLFLLILLPIISNSQNRVIDLSEFNDFETYDKTMVFFQKVFERNSEDILKHMCTEKFIKSNRYKVLKKLVKKNHINTSYTNELFIKEFPVLNSKEKVVIHFKNDSTFFWFIEDAFTINSKKQKIHFKKKGFKPLASEFNFVDFTNALEDKKLFSYQGIAPYGKLPLSFFNSKKIVRSRKSTLYIKDIILHNNNKIKGIYVAKLVYQPSLEKNKRGWIIDDFISMSEYTERNLLLDFLLKDTKKYDLKKNSNYFYCNLKGFIPCSKKNFDQEDENVKTIVTKKIKPIDYDIEITSNVNMRDSPSKEGKIIEKVKKSGKYIIIDESKINDQLFIDGQERRNKWLKINYEGKFGWIYGYYTKRLKVKK